MGVNLGTLVRHKKKYQEQWPDIGDARLESRLGSSGSIPGRAMTAKWPISLLWICVDKCEYTVLLERRTEQSQLPLDKCLMQVTRAPTFASLAKGC